MFLFLKKKPWNDEVHLDCKIKVNTWNQYLLINNMKSEQESIQFEELLN